MATRSRRIDPDVLEVIEERALRGDGPAAIERELLRRPAIAPRAPALRTIQRVVRGLTADPSEPWSLQPGGPEPGPILRSLEASLLDGWRIPISAREAAWIVVVHGAAPDLGPLTTRYLARMYLAAEAQGASTAWLDTALAMAPWRGADERRRYESIAGDSPRITFLLNERQAKL